MADQPDRVKPRKPAYVHLAEFGTSLLGIGLGIVVAVQWPDIQPYRWWFVGAGALLAIIGWVCRIWVTEKVP
jgi:hypothetical protein